MDFRLAHTNINVLDLERSLDFYQKALDMRIMRRHEASDGSFTLTFLSDADGRYQIELTQLRNRTEPYDLGDNESHICFTTTDIEAARRRHAEMGCIVFENHKMGLYFIEDPDGYWIEITPAK